MTSHDEWDELAAGYALHGLSPEDEALFIAHLASCPECTTSLNEHELVAAQLGSISHYQDDDEAPSWESMRAAILGDRAAVPAVADLAAQRRRYNVSRRILAAAAAVVIVAGGGIAVWQLTSGGSSCSASAGCHKIQLDASGKTLASVIVRNNAVTVTPTDMPAAPSGKVYVLWQLPRSGRATPLGEFTAGSKAPVSAGLLHAPYGATTAFAVSLEPSGTPPATPSNMLATGTTST
jgi:Anti-sigma-K factor rskA/Putative zinc-finger